MSSLSLLALAVGFVLTGNISHPYEESPFGFHPASVIREGYQSEPYQDAAYIGIRWTRPPVYAMWFIVQPDISNPIYDFSMYDRQYGSVPDSINILGNIVPQGRIDEGYCLPDSYLPIDIVKYRQFVRATVERYDGDDVDDMPGLTNPITYWQVGNEPNDVMELGFAELQRITYLAIKDACPEATVLIGGVSGFPNGYVSHFDEAYAPILQELGGAYVDIFDFHWYGSASGEYRFIDTETGEDVLAHIRETLSGNGFPDTLPIWITENGSYSGDPDFSVGIDPPYQSEAQQAGDYFKRFVYSPSRGVSKIFPAFGLMEGFNYDAGYFDFTGLIYDGWGSYDQGLGDKKLGYYTYKKMTEKLEGADWSTLEILNVDSPFDVHVYRLFRDGQVYHVTWWDYFMEADYEPGDTVFVALDGISCDALQMTTVVAHYPLGWMVDDYDSAFTVTRFPVESGTVVFPLSESPVILEPTEPSRVSNDPPLPESHLSVYPVPTSGLCRIISDGVSMVSIFDLHGRSIYSMTVGASGVLEIDVRHTIQPGTYLLRTGLSVGGISTFLIVLP